MFDLWWYQREMKDKAQAAWDAGAKVVMPVLPTGAGKTVVIGQTCREHDGDGFCMAHRSELVAQISVALGRAEIPHNIVASEAVRRSVLTAHHKVLGRSWIDNRAGWHVGSVDTVLKREIPHLRKPLIVQDEGHHVLAGNKWGRAFQMFPANSLGMFPTATPGRADGKGLGREYDGLVDVLLEGPGMRDLIGYGNLTDYDVLMPQVEDLELDDVDVTASGEFNMLQAARAIARSRKMVGSIVDTYREFAYGRRAVTFAVDIAEAQKITDAFNAAGIPTALVTGEDGEDKRRNTIQAFAQGKLWNLVNVDLFGEGFDLPAIEVVIMARPTMSFPLFAQQWGRALRLMVGDALMKVWGTFTDAERLAYIANSPKPRALIIDHVGNMIRHKGPPDKPRVHSLSRRDRRAGADDSIPLTSCLKCLKPYERIHPKCPWCGHVHVPSGAGRDLSLKELDGDLALVPPELLAKMRGDVVDPTRAPFVPKSIKGTYKAAGAIQNINARNRAHQNLRHAVGCWAGMYPNEDQRTRERRFYHTFKVDILTALSGSKSDAETLTARVAGAVTGAGFVLSSFPFEVDPN